MRELRELRDRTVAPRTIASTSRRTAAASARAVVRVSMVMVMVMVMDDEETLYGCGDNI
jgi:hypothetical protein